jgi:hypothetical protein
MVRTLGVTSNRDGVGARITVNAGGVQQVREIRTGSGLYGQNDLRATFGVGPQSRIDVLEVRWPSGVVDRIQEIQTNRIVTVQEGVGLLDLPLPKGVSR